LQSLLFDKTILENGPSAEQGPSPATLSRWFEALHTLHRWAACSQEFYVEAAKCAVESIGLDGAIVLRRRDEGWEIAASHLPDPQFKIHHDLEILDQLLDQPKTLFHGKEETTPDNTAVVVSPFWNLAGELAGAIYGLRTVREENGRRGIRYLEAHCIELLANAVSDGIARLEQETAFAQRKSLIELDHQRMAGELREVTVLFVDLREFSKISISLGMLSSGELLGQVLDGWTAAVMEHDGLIIDYYGDGLSAMWNAPADQPEHPELACRAALQMLETLPEVSRCWQQALGNELRLGIGIHTGPAQVGNSGSSQQVKYGPRGMSVHLASRVEASTKPLQTPILITRATAEKLSNRLRTHHVCRAKLPGVPEPVDLLTLSRPTDDQALLELGPWDIYHQALDFFEQGKLEQAAEALDQANGELTTTPAHFLANQIRQAQEAQNGRRSTDQRTAMANRVITFHGK